MITFEAEGHIYRRVQDGAVVPSVTQILKATRVSSEFTGVNSGTLEIARALGTAVHADCHAYDDNDPDWSTVHPEVRPYLDAWIQYRKDEGAKPSERERLLYHPTLQYAGTLDFFQAPDLLIDIKTGDPDDAAAQFQTAAYAMALRPSDYMTIKRASVLLCPERKTKPYRVFPYKDLGDYSVWRAIVTTYHNGHGRRQK